jgi:Zn-dependent protease with chaperone function
MAQTAAQRRRQALIQRLQDEARRAPAAYRTRVVLLAWLGFAMLGLVVLLALAPLVLIVVALLRAEGAVDPMVYVFLTGQVAFSVLLLRALWLPIDPPAGHRLQPEEAPELHALIERLRVEAGVPPLAGVVIDDSLNAAASSRPRALGLLGERHDLVLGLPLLRLLDRDELAAVIAHEFGHFRGGHGRLSAWVYRLRRGWSGVAEAMARMGHGLSFIVLRPFFRWYLPHFDAWSFVLAREDEYAADAVSAQLAGAEAQISALIRLEHAADWLQRRCWAPMEARMRAQPQPPLSICTEIARWLAEAPPPDPLRVLVATEREIDIEDTHPTLPQRVAAFGASAALRAQGEIAATWFEPAALGRIERALDTAWREEVRKVWSERHAEAAPDRARLEALERDEQGRGHDAGPDSAGPDKAAQALEYAQLIERLRPERDALRDYGRVLALAPDDATALFRAGALRVDAGDVEGVALLHRAMRADAGAIRPVFALLDGWRRAAALPAAVAAELETLRDRFAAQAASLEARDGVDAEDALVAHDLDPAAMAELDATLARFPQVSGAWLVRKRLDLPGEAPHYTLLVSWRGSVASEAAGLKRLVAALRLPGSVTVFSDSDSAQRALARRVRALCPEPFYRRG